MQNTNNWVSYAFILLSSNICCGTMISRFYIVVIYEKSFYEKIATKMQIETRVYKREVQRSMQILLEMAILSIIHLLATDIDANALF